MRLLPLLAAVGASIGLLVFVLWQRSPILAVALVGPLAALVLYERSIRRGRAAMRLALTDPLTGVGNQRGFRQRLRRELARAAVAGRTVAVCLIDVDDFKRINDEQGHQAGDLVLVAVAGSLRQAGETFRLGGDEFVLLSPGQRDEEAIATGRETVRRIAALRIGNVGRVTVSAGLAAFPADGATRDELTSAADERLYRAKRRGGDQLVAGSKALTAADGASG